MGHKTELVKANRLSHIPYASTPLAEGGEIEYLTPEEFEKKFNITYTESTWGDTEELRSHLNNEALVQRLKSNPNLPFVQSKIPARLASPLACLVICNMGEEIGHGLYASQDIPAGTILFFYAGVIDDAKPFSAGDSYAYSWAHTRELTPSSVKAVSALSYGGMARFMQHLPVDTRHYRECMKQSMLRQLGPVIAEKKFDLDAYVMDIVPEPTTPDELDLIIFDDPAVRQQIAIANVQVTQVIHNDIPLIMCRTEHGIKKNEIIGIAYGEQYWRSEGKTPYYFTKTGAIIPRENYKRINDKCTQTSSAALIQSYQTTNPLTLYNEGVAAYKNNNFQEAKSKILLALEGFKNKHGEKNLEQAKCLSTLASVYRELSELDNAINACEAAMLLFDELEKTALEGCLTKYYALLKLSNKTPKELYENSVNLFKQKSYLLGIYQLQFLIDNDPGDDEEQTATYHSTIASCYREVGNLTEAKIHIEKAILLREQKLGSEDPLTQNARNKLDGIEKKLRENTISTTSLSHA